MIFNLHPTLFLSVRSYMLRNGWHEQYMNESNNLIIFSKINNAISLPANVEHSLKKPIQSLINFLSSFEERSEKEIYIEIESIVTSKLLSLLREGTVGVEKILIDSTRHTMEEAKTKANSEEFVWITNGKSVFSYPSEYILEYPGTIQSLLDSGNHLGQYPHLLWYEQNEYIEDTASNTLMATNHIRQAIVKHRTTFYPEMLIAVAEYVYYLFMRSDRKSTEFKNITVKEFSKTQIHMNVLENEFTAADILKRLIAKLFTEGFSSTALLQLIREFPDEIDDFINSSLQPQKIAIGYDTIPEIFNGIVDIPSIRDLIMQQIDDTYEKVNEMSVEFLLAMGKRMK